MPSSSCQPLIAPPTDPQPNLMLSTLPPQGDEQQETSRAAVTPAAAAAGRPPAAKKRRNAAATAAAPRPPPSSASLNDLATLAAAVAAEETFDNPLLGEQDQEQGILAAYQSGSLGALSAQPEAAAATGRGARGGSRSRKSTPAPSSSGADEGDSLGLSFPSVNEDGKPLVSGSQASSRGALVLLGCCHPARPGMQPTAAALWTGLAVIHPAKPFARPSHACRPCCSCPVCHTADQAADQAPAPAAVQP